MSKPLPGRSIALLLLSVPHIAMAADKVEFNRSVLPILSNHCFPCHGPDAKTREAGLRLDVRESAIKRNRSGDRAIAPGDVAASELLLRVTAEDEDHRMPPVDGGKPLSTEQIEVLAAWIEQGADYQSHWAFIRPTMPKKPRVQRADWVKNDIDRFILARLEREGMEPAAEASRETLIRRVSFDLTGLPPTLAEIDTFLSDKSPEAYARIVDHYLDSSAYGEHMARQWLDLARYADSNGYQYDTERQQWVWRDWVIDAYNRNKPFDEFTVEQLAGDLLPGATAQQKLATGFNRNHGITIEGGVIDEEYRTEYVMDRLVTTGAVWMALTIGCARCHDHKYDPISQTEFYQLYAFFNQVPERGANGFAPKQRIASPLAAAQQQKRRAELSLLRAELKKPTNVEEKLARWVREIVQSPAGGWSVLRPETMKSSGGTRLTRLDDNSILAGGTNPRADTYDISARTDATKVTAIRLEALTHETLPGGGPGRHRNSNFVLSEFELTAVSERAPSQQQVIRFVRAVADYSQAGYEVARAIDGTVADSRGWAVDGPTRKEAATAIFVAAAPFGYEGGTELRFRLRHEANFGTHGVGRPRLSITTDAPESLQLKGIPVDIREIAGKAKDRRSRAQNKRLRDYFLTHHNPNQALQDRISAIEKEEADSFPETMVMQDMDKRRVTRVLNRGQYNEPADVVEPGVPEIFPPLKAKSPSSPQNRMDFARWLVDPDHPLTARVAVNRYWQRVFGVGLVKTSEDLGVQGALPSHPALLDALALEFVRSGWDIKHMYRLLLNSATYRQTSHVGGAAYRRDPENRLLARGPRMRLDAEEVRDTALAVSGLLVRRLGGRSVYPYQPKGLWLELNNRPGYSKAYAQGKGDDLYRRSLYTFWKRTVPSPMLKTFDAPEREFCTIQRSRTNTPLQALLLLNGPQFVEAARKLGERMMTEGGRTIDERITFGFRLVTAREPTRGELLVFREAYAEELMHYSKDKDAALKLLKVGESSFDAELDAAELAAMTSLARLLLNTDEAITKG